MENEEASKTWYYTEWTIGIQISSGDVFFKFSLNDKASEKFCE